jgi:hypothetical protein
VRYWVEGDLPAAMGGIVAQLQRGERMAGFMNRGGKKNGIRYSRQVFYLR